MSESLVRPRAVAANPIASRSAEGRGTLWLSFAIVVLLPVAFWTGLVALTSHLAGLGISAVFLIGLAILISALLIGVWSAISLGKGRDAAP